MRFKKVLGFLLTVWLATGISPLSGKSSRPASKTPATSSKSKPGTKSQAKTKAVSSRSKKSSAGATTRARRVGPPKQQQPTTERYIEIQQALAARGYYDGPIDGEWTATCTESLKRFQTDQNLAPDGKLGALSLIALGLGPKREPLPPQFDSKPEPAQ